MVATTGPPAMSDFPPLASAPPTGPEDRVPSPDEARELLRECFEAYSVRVAGGAYDSLEMASDLFESTTAVPDSEIATFRTNRAQWLDRFERAIAESFESWLKGTRRHGRRPDKDASAATLSVMTPFDQEKQAALVEATGFLSRFTKRETAALDARVSVLVPGPTRERDNPFGPDYVLDALGATSRSVYPNPRVWRPLMVRLLGDMTPIINKIYISLNRTLADRGVLPDMKAALRARSEFRPADDKDLLPTFSRMMSEAGTAADRYRRARGLRHDVGERHFRDSARRLGPRVLRPPRSSHRPRLPSWPGSPRSPSSVNVPEEATPPRPRPRATFPISTR